MIISRIVQARQKSGVSVSIRTLMFLLTCVVLSAPCCAAPQVSRTASVEDAIELTRIQLSTTETDRVAAVSPDGRHFAIVTWRGEVTRNRNVYTLSLVDALDGHPPKELITFEFTGDPMDMYATPIADVTFVGDGRRIAFLGREKEAPAQVYVVDIASGSVRRLTNHPTAVRSFIVSREGKLRAFSAVGEIDMSAREARLSEDGVFTPDRSLFPFERPGLTGIAQLLDHTSSAHREYFLFGVSRPFFDSRRSRPQVVAEDEPATLEHDIVLNNFAQLTGDRSGRYALLYPYARTEHPMHPERYNVYAGHNSYSRQIAAPYGLVDLHTGKVEVLVDAPSPLFASGAGSAFWSPDSRSIVLFTLDPQNPAQQPTWVELDVASRRTSAIGVPDGWSAINFLESGRAILLQKDRSLATVSRAQSGQWGTFRVLGTITQFDDNWKIATNGKVAVGVTNGPHNPPQLASLDIETGTVKALTDLNPWLRHRRLGEVEDLRLEGEAGPYSAGFLVKPVGYMPGKRYPLVFLFDDHTMGSDRAPFLFDAEQQLNGHAIQPLAAQGFMVFYSRQPSMEGVIETSAEGRFITRYVESVIAELDDRELIDLGRIGISGWSRAGYHTQVVLMNSLVRFAAASVMDGGGREYNDRIRPFTDIELGKIRCPLLYEAYGIHGLVYWGQMADRMFANSQPTETLYYQTAPHATVRPKHRLRSLQTHIDWWRFWLKGEEDPTVLSVARYPRWREMKKSQCGRLAGDDRPWYCEQ